jgi:tRNA pseudouridine55 synthase
VSGAKKVGHAGTLDPFSTGLVVVMLGRGTKLSQFLMGGRKHYAATIHLGVETDTYDPDGRVICRKEFPPMGRARIEEALKPFLGEIDQVPPAYSAVHVNGQRAYKLARKGQHVELPHRKVTIHEIRILSVDMPEVQVEVLCSRGTYLRSLAYDLGRALKVGAHLSSLRRLASGPFRVQDAVKSTEVGGPKGRERLMDQVIPLAQALPDARAIHIHEVMAEKIRNGYKPSEAELSSGASDMKDRDGPVRLLCDGELVAVMDMAAGPGDKDNHFKTMRVFH